MLSKAKLRRRHQWMHPSARLLLATTCRQGAAEASGLPQHDLLRRWPGLTPSGISGNGKRAHGQRPVMVARAMTNLHRQDVAVAPARRRSAYEATRCKAMVAALNWS
ncbi:hypothetical protein ZWY2020_008708 [Hordeum vulgare]|nr:hypothetical protein ZWY2020_008708 [Hordeum vulgare]